MHKVQNLDYTCFTKLLLMQLYMYVSSAFYSQVENPFLFFILLP